MLPSVERSVLASQSGPARPSETETLARLLVDRFSCRAFLPDPVPEDLIDQMLAIAQMSPSWCNTQPWQVTIISGDATERFRTALLAEAEEENPGPPDIAFPSDYTGRRLERRREVGWQLYESAGIAKGDRAASARQARENQRLFGAPHALLIHSSRELGTYGAVDCGVYLGTLLLAAQSLGLGIVPQAALARHSALIRRHFGVPDDRIFVVGASFGFADPVASVNLFRSRRAPLEQSVVRLTD